MRVEEIAPARWGSRLDSRHAQTRQALADRIQVTLRDLYADGVDIRLIVLGAEVGIATADRHHRLRTNPPVHDHGDEGYFR